MPPVNGFWSLTMYDKKGFLVDNAIDRYNLGGMKDLTYNKDGSLDIFIQAQEPEKLKSNWLPSPQAGMEFELTFRMYYPKENVIDRSYTMPGVKKVQ
jgi:DNA sulfur modification protein DndE